MKSNDFFIDKMAKATGFSSLRNNRIGGVTVNLKFVINSKTVPKMVRFFNKYIYRFGIGCSMNRYTGVLSFYSSKSDKKLYDAYSENEIFCNFGSGAFNHPRWVNFDFPGNSEYYQAVQGKEGKDFHAINLCDEDLQIPYRDGSVSLIYCSHTLEHLEEKKGIHFLKECYRVMKKGGVLRLVIPSTDMDFKHSRLIFGQKNIDHKIKVASLLSSAVHTVGSMASEKKEIIEQCVIDSGFNAEQFYKACSNNGIDCSFDPKAPEKHITFWDHDKLLRFSNQIGYEYFFPFYRGSSIASPFKNLEVFDNTEPHVSIYCELVK